MHRHLVALLLKSGVTDKDIMQNCWTLANDFYLGPACCMFKPERCAEALLLMAQSIVGVEQVIIEKSEEIL